MGACARAVAVGRPPSSRTRNRPANAWFSTRLVRCILSPRRKKRKAGVRRRLPPPELVTRERGKKAFGRNTAKPIAFSPSPLGPISVTASSRLRQPVAIHGLRSEGPRAGRYLLGGFGPISGLLFSTCSVP